jgi:endoglucanase
MRGLRLSFIATALTVVSLPAPAQYMRGVNVSGAEFGSGNEDPTQNSDIPGQYGSTYTYQSPPTFDYFGARGLNFLRVEILWERLQPTLQGPLDPDNLGYLRNDIAWAKAAGSVININLQNYGRYTIKGTVCVIDNPCGSGGQVLVTSADLADFWSKMAAEFVDEPGVFSYDIMNEPHDMGVAIWNQISQEVVNAIRMQDPNKAIMVEGDSWANATDWASNNGATPWINDTGNNIWYEGHVYFDSDYSGEYKESYDQELAANSGLADVGVTRLKPFVNWCTTNNVKCYVGEYGIPNGGPQPADYPNTIPDPRWLTVLDNFLTALDQAGLSGTYWAAGEKWGDYPLSVEPTDDFTTDAEQLPTLMNHLQPNLLRTTSAAASYGYTVAPGGLVAGYGKGLAAGIEVATATPWPAQLGDTQVQVTDANGTTSFAGLLYVSDSQINYQLPAGMASGLAQVSVLDKGAQVSSGILEVQPISPTVFTMNDDGTGVAAAYVQPVTAGGTSDGPPVLVATYDVSQGQWVAAPISFNGQNLVLELFGTGFDATGNTQVQVQIGTTIVEATSAGPGGGYPGEDQIVVPLPSSLAGSGQVNVQAEFKTLVNGTITYTYTNPVTITFQ